MTEFDVTERSVLHATFALERRYDAPPARVFAAWADPATKARWFVGAEGEHELDFQVGGIEVNRNLHDGRLLTFASRYCDIVTDRRIVFTSTLSFDENLATASVTSVQLQPAGSGCQLVLTQSGTYLDGHELPTWREQGTGAQLDALARELHPA
jgi:uncharacterized protein YndB with AHSA1/START domain